MITVVAKPTLQVVAENVRRYRKARGWTQAELAEKLGRHQSKIAVIEAAKHDLSTSVIDELADALEVPPAALITPVELGAAQLS